MARWVRRLGEIGASDVRSVGGKAANLGELIAAELPVPDGFVVVEGAHLDALDAAGIRTAVAERVAGAPVDDSTALERVSDELRAMVGDVEVPTTTCEEVLAAYASLGYQVRVAVRSSAPYEDAAGSSFAGMHETITDVVGGTAVVAAVRRCWASAYRARAIAYRHERRVDAEPSLAVVVQRMVDSDRSGIAFTADPRSGDRDRLLIEATYGLGEAIVSGSVEPDTYVVAKQDWARLDTRIGAKAIEIEREPSSGVDVVKPVDDERRAHAALTDDEVIAVAELAVAVEAHYGVPQDIEWAIAEGHVWLLQARPITTLVQRDCVPRPTGPAPLLSGLAASPGVASGPVRVLHDHKEGSSLLAGEVLVAPMTTPDWTPILRRGIL